jgi:hypothetical protein
VHPALLSANAKTGVSFNLPVGATCRPTALCAEVCYATAPSALTTRKAWLRKYHRNLRYIRLEEPDAVVARLTREFRGAQRAWARRGIPLECLRVNGLGDLTAELVPVINAFARANPAVKVWVVTKRFDLAADIETLPNVYLALSIDRTTPAALVERARRLVEAHARAYLAFLRTAPGDDTLGAAIVYDEKKAAGLPFDPVTGCPVDAGLMPLDNERGFGGSACAKCGKCFSDEVLARQRGCTPATPVGVSLRRHLDIVADGVEYRTSGVPPVPAPHVPSGSYELHQPDDVARTFADGADAVRAMVGGKRPTRLVGPSGKVLVHLQLSDEEILAGRKGGRRGPR